LPAHWNPIEHRLFSQISNNWAGRPLQSYETALKYIRTTSTSTGLAVCARMLFKNMKKANRSLLSKCSN
jgi:Rhodopirellula transposase DDE domain